MSFFGKINPTAYRKNLEDINTISCRFQGEEGILQFSDNLNIDALNMALQILWEHKVHLSFFDDHWNGHFDYFHTYELSYEGYWLMTVAHNGISWGDYRIKSDILLQQLFRLIQNNQSFCVSLREIPFSSSHGIRSLEASLQKESEILAIAEFGKGNG